MSDDLGEIYSEGDTTRYVVRVSRTATGTRTYTAGVSIPGGDGTRDGEYLARLFAIEDVVAGLIDREAAVLPANVRRFPPIVPKPDAAQRAETELAKGRMSGKGDGWYTTPELVKVLGVSRQHVVSLLTKMRDAGAVEKEQGEGGRPSRYRLVSPTQSTRKEK